MKASRPAIFGFIFAAVMGMSVPAIAAKGSRHAGPIQRIREVMSQLSLSDEQQPRVNTILDEAEQKVAQLKQEAKAAGDKEAVKAKAKELMKDTVGKLSHVLTPAQRGKLRELMKEAHAQNKAGNPKAAAATQPSAAN